MQIRLVQASSEGEPIEGGEVVEFDCEGEDRFIVGRSGRAHFTVARDDLFFSRIHFAVEVQGPRCYVCDTRSLNGTKVNGEGIDQGQLVLLRPGDTVGGGGTYFRVEYVIPERDRGRYSEIDLPAPQGAIEESSGGVQEPGQLVFDRDDGGEIVLERSVRRRRLRCERCGAEEPEEEAEIPLDLDGAEYICDGCRAELQSAAGEPAEVTGYEIIRVINIGGMGVIYEARQQATGRRVALKTIIPEDSTEREARLRFLREMGNMERLEHPNIAEHLDSGTLPDGRLFIAMEFVEGQDALDWLQENGPPGDPALACRVVLPALEAMQYAHQQRCIHRDLKPNNLMLTDEPPAGTTKVIDFGCAKAAHDAGLTRPRQVLGNRMTMSPDQLLECRNPTPQMDIYSVGACLYMLITGAPPYNFASAGGNRRSPVEMILNDDPVPLTTRRRGVPREIRRVVERAMHREPQMRYGSMSEMHSALERAIR